MGVNGSPVFSCQLSANRGPLPEQTCWKTTLALIQALWVICSLGPDGPIGPAERQLLLPSRNPHRLQPQSQAHSQPDSQPGSKRRAASEPANYSQRQALRSPPGLPYPETTAEPRKEPTLVESVH
ncbi:hypothetical protein AAFF_G00432510 [Aldrovandia affinis]|uniref:Uncharacterized protein n=1 Tax=Aldrovandia affinis TaxID=143900 RepID=A0AAD7WJ29_9TELE|nr:hypothetical protein AAFF_G00432510 [Aldrovandia affinis]